jgi:hypothetical protein
VLWSVGSASRAAEPPDTYSDRVVRDVEGWTVRIDPALFEESQRPTGERALQALANHLQRVTYIVPADRLEQLKTLPIWVDWHHDSLGAMQYHPSRQWLVEHGHDPRLARHVHIPRATELIDARMWAKHPYVVLHELAHAYHDQILGFDREDIRVTYEMAKERAIYDRVLLFTGETVKHYGMTNHKEYFAEATEAYFGVNDFFPFVRAELQQHDPKMFELLQSIWGKVE